MDQAEVLHQLVHCVTCLLLFFILVSVILLLLHLLCELFTSPILSFTEKLKRLCREIYSTSTIVSKDEIGTLAETLIQ